MSKMKTRKSIAKRIRKTKTGKLQMRRRTTQHLVARVSKRAAQHSGKLVKLPPAMVGGIKKLIPYI